MEGIHSKEDNLIEFLDSFARDMRSLDNPDVTKDSKRNVLIFETDEQAIEASMHDDHAVIEYVRESEDGLGITFKVSNKGVEIRGVLKGGSLGDETFRLIRFIADLKKKGIESEVLTYIEDLIK